MSYILEALKKSEQERQIGHVPDIIAVQETLPHAHGSRWPWLVLGALVLNAVAIGLFAWRPWSPDDAAVDRQTAAPVQVPRAELPPTVAPFPATTTESAEEYTEAEDRSYAMQAPLTAAPVRNMEPVVEPVIEPQVEPIVNERAGGLSDAPRWDDLTAEERNRLPVPRIDVHVFAQDPTRRFVLIDLRKYQEGDRLDQGVTLEAIRADGIVLSYQGQRYRVGRP